MYILYIYMQNSITKYYDLYNKNSKENRLKYVFSFIQKVKSNERFNKVKDFLKKTECKVSTIENVSKYFQKQKITKDSKAKEYLEKLLKEIINDIKANYKSIFELENYFNSMIEKSDTPLFLRSLDKEKPIKIVRGTYIDKLNTEEDEKDRENKKNMENYYRGEIEKIFNFEKKILKI